MLVVKTTGCKRIWPSLGCRGIIGWFHTEVNCSDVKSGKTENFRNKTYTEERQFSFWLGLPDFSPWKLKWGDSLLSALALVRFLNLQGLLCWGCLLWSIWAGMRSELRMAQAWIIERGEGKTQSSLQTAEWHCIQFIYLCKFNSLPSAENNTFRAYKLSRMGNSAHLSKQHACVSKQTWEVGMKMLFPWSHSYVPLRVWASHFSGFTVKSCLCIYPIYYVPCIISRTYSIYILLCRFE